MPPHLSSNRPLVGLVDPDLVGLPPAFAARVHLHRRGWTTHQATIAAGRRLVACAERDGHRIRCEAEEPAAAWLQVFSSVEPGTAAAPRP